MEEDDSLLLMNTRSCPWTEALVGLIPFGFVLRKDFSEEVLAALRI
jgi:hypothetical protein